MNSKKRLYKLDDIGFVGTQKKIPAIVKKRMEQKTGDIIRAAKAQSASVSKIKKAS
jgi:hypothetical protein